MSEQSVRRVLLIVGALVSVLLIAPYFGLFGNSSTPEPSSPSVEPRRVPVVADPWPTAKPVAIRERNNANSTPESERLTGGGLSEIEELLR